MGITETEALALILGGTFLVGTLFADEMKLQSARAVLFVGGLAMLLFGIADIVVDHL